MPCRHYQIWKRRITRRSRPDQRLRFFEITAPYCTHPQSPLPLEAAQQGLGEGQSLTCAGFVRRCPLPDGIRPQHSARTAMTSPEHRAED